MIKSNFLFRGKEGEMNRQSTGNIQSSIIILYDAIIVDTCHYISVKTRRIYNTKSEHCINYGLQLIIIYQYWLINYNICTTLMQDVSNRGNYWAMSGMWDPCILSNLFFCKPKLLHKRKFINLKNNNFPSYFVSLPPSSFPYRHCIYRMLYILSIH